MAANRDGRLAIVLVLICVVIAPVIFHLTHRPAVQRKYPPREKVVMWHMWTAEWKKVVDQIVERFNESQDEYELVALSVPSSAADAKFLLAVAGGSYPDIMCQWSQVIPSWAEKGLLMPLDELMSPEEWADFQKTTYPCAKKIGIYKGRLYGVTTGMNSLACYYIPQDFRDAGLDPDKFPKSLEELVAIGDKLNKFDKKGNLIHMGFMAKWWLNYVNGFGGGFYDWENNKLTLDDPGNLRALEFLTEQRKKLGFQNVVRYESGLQTGVGGAEWPFMTGSYSIVVDGQWRVQQLAKFAPKLEYRTAPIPTPAGGRPNFCHSNGNFILIPKGAKNVKGAWAFAKFWSGLEKPERAAEFATWGGWLPLNSRVVNAPIYQKYIKEHPQFKTFVDLLASENVKPSSPVPFQNFLGDRITRADDLAMRGALTPKEAIEELKRDVAQEMKRRKELRYGD